MIPLIAIGLGLLAVDLIVRAESKASGTPSGGPLVTTDPRIDPSHPLGALPCPGNPPPPAGLKYWQGPVSAAVSDWSVHALHTYPIGTVIQDFAGGQPVAARIEYHTLQGATGLSGCFKGCSLMQSV